MQNEGICHLLKGAPYLQELSCSLTQWWLTWKQMGVCLLTCLHTMTAICPDFKMRYAKVQPLVAQQHEKKHHRFLSLGTAQIVHNLPVIDSIHVEVVSLVTNL